MVDGQRDIPPTSGNWRRWGSEDERGTANFADERRLVAAAKFVRSGRVFSLALPLDSSTMPVNPHRAPPVHLMSIDGGDFAAGYTIPGGFCAADDYLAMPTQTGTHIDALSHVWYDQQLYNGFSSNCVRSAGAERLGIEKLRHLAGRGVLLDVAAHLGVSHLESGKVISEEELASCAKAQNVDVRQGDILLIRTGWLGTYSNGNCERFWGGNPGIGLSAASWIGERHVAAVAADNFAVEAHPSETGTIGPVHKLLIRDYGCYLMEMVVLDELAAAGVHEFLFVAAPLPIVGGTGSPLNPLAIA